MARVMVTLEIEAGGTAADALEAVNSVLDDGMPQDSFNESFGEMRVLEARAVLHPEPARVFREYSLRYLMRVPRYAGLGFGGS